MVRADHNIEDGSITVNSISVTDTRGLDVDVSVRYQINSATIPQTIAQYGSGLGEMLVNPNVRDAIREIIAHYPAKIIPIKRAEIGTQLDKLVQSKLDGIKGKPLFFAGSNLRAVTLPQKIRANITKVQEARQQAEQSKQATELAKQEAHRKAAVAEGAAKKRRISADALAYTRVTEAKATAEAIEVKANARAHANKVLAESLTPPLISLKEIEARQKLYESTSLKIVPENSNMLFVDFFKNSKCT